MQQELRIAGWLKVHEKKYVYPFFLVTGKIIWTARVKQFGIDFVANNWNRGLDSFFLCVQFLSIFQFTWYSFQFSGVITLGREIAILLTSNILPLNCDRSDLIL